jgi:hypothetical protein
MLSNKDSCPRLVVVSSLPEELWVVRSNPVMLEAFETRAKKV